MTALVPDPAGTPPQSVRVVNIANGLTLLRLLLVPVFAALLLHDGGSRTSWRIAAWAVFAVASVTDRIDGQLARSRGLVTEFGKLADPIADKALTGTALVGLSSLGLLWWWVTVVILAREIGVTLLRFWVIRHGVIPASRGGKLKTLLQAVAIGLYVLPLSGPAAVVAAVVMAAALVLTLATGVDYVARAVSLRRAGLRRIAAASTASAVPIAPAVPPPSLPVEPTSASTPASPPGGHPPARAGQVVPPNAEQPAAPGTPADPAQAGPAPGGPAPGGPAPGGPADPAPAPPAVPAPADQAES